MCNRYNSITAGTDVGRMYFVGKLGASWVSQAAETVPPTVFPGYLGHVLRLRESELGLDAMRFGIVPFWAKDPADKRYRATNNARGETVATLATFREPFKRRRCLVPAESFFEWPTIAGKKLMHRVARADGSPILFAGIWDRWSRDGEELLSMAIITSEPHPSVRWLHHRMPVILDESRADLWLDPSTPADVLQGMLVSPTADAIDVCASVG